MKKRIISAMLIIAMMVIIFIFSAKPAAVSSHSSMRITGLLLYIFPFLKKVDFLRNGSYEYENLEFIIRKCAHMTEYCIFASFWCIHISTYRIKKKTLWLSVIFSALYAITDEFHQTFVEGRSGELRDVCIDTAGAFIGMLIFVSVCRLSVKRKAKG